MIETQASIVAWGRATFGDAMMDSKSERERRFREEVAELLLSLAEPVETFAHLAEEIADVYHTLCALADAHGIELHTAIDVKMRSLRASEFVKAVDGRVVRKGKEHLKSFDEAMPTVMVVLGKVSRQV